MLTMAARFWEKVERTPGCWVWTSTILRSGYGQFWPGKGRKHALAHRVAWELTWGAVPDGLCVLHACDNRRCVRPAHLFLGTLKDNAADCARKGRGGFQQPGKIIRPRGERSGKARLNDSAVKTIFRLASWGWSQPRIGALLGVAHSTVGRVLRRETWSHVAPPALEAQP